jgi:predicted transcriptional regulator
LSVKQKELKQIEVKLKNSFKKLRGELDNHLDGINQNSNEIQNSYEYLTEIERKVDRLSERIDKLFLMINPEEDIKQFELTHREQEIFLQLYTSKEKLSLNVLARKAGLSLEMVTEYIKTIAAKGVLIIREIKNNTNYVYIDESFKEKQTKFNIVKILGTHL